MRRRAQLVLDSYGSTEDVTRLVSIAIRRLRDLAALSLEKAEEFGRPALRDDAEFYRRDADRLTGMLADGFWSVG